METTHKPHGWQYSLRTLLSLSTWVAMVLAICVGYQRAAARQREETDHLRAARVMPAVQTPGRQVVPTGPLRRAPVRRI